MRLHYDPLGTRMTGEVATPMIETNAAFADRAALIALTVGLFGGTIGQGRSSSQASPHNSLRRASRPQP